MRREMRGLVSLALGALILTAAGSIAGAENNVLRVGVREAVPGFGYKNATSQTYSGMEIDLARMIAAELKYSDIEFVPVTANTREEALDTGEVDCVIAIFSVTEERQEKYWFSDTYYTDNLRILVENSTGIKDLSGMVDSCVGVTEGSTAALDFAEEMEKQGKIQEFSRESFDTDDFDGGITFRQYDTHQEMGEALEEGEIDAICADGSILNGYLTEERSFLTVKFSPQDYGVCTLKDSDLAEKIGPLITAWNEDGTISQLMVKWDLE